MAGSVSFIDVAWIAGRHSVGAIRSIAALGGGLTSVVASGVCACISGQARRLHDAAF